jgi:hypothetical protein
MAMESAAVTLAPLVKLFSIYDPEKAEARGARLL